MDIVNALEHFFKYLQIEKQYSIHTLKAYRQDLEHYFVFFTKRKKEEWSKIYIHEIKLQDLKLWLVNLKKQKYKHTTLNRKIATLRAFFNFLTSKHIHSENPSQKLQVFKTDQGLSEYISQEALLKCIAKLEIAADFESLRNQLILEILYGTGIRSQELINLKIKDLDLNRSLIQIQGKGKKMRLIPIYNRLKRLITTYLDYCKNMSKEDYLLITKKGKPLYRMLVNRVLNKLLYEVNVEQKSAHTLRHTFATHLLNNHAELNYIKELLGHESLAATQIYTHNDISNMKKAIQNNLENFKNKV